MKIDFPDFFPSPIEKEPNTDIIVDTRNADRRKTMSQKQSGLTVHTEGSPWRLLLLFSLPLMAGWTPP